ncbi:MAG: 50S ribosomal protein L29 [Blastochloris viridis]|uniref:Large ribosomal subunit protein uL29 n=1 Tax=Blastochloris viridis TaxID=1079 RepID=A0A6N4R4V8_BLAVI|nr:MAG: 50S ribosomal protein L29 [Blastochloris viridis]
MQMSELVSKSAAQLKETLLQLRREQLNLRFQKSAGQLANVNRWREVRTSIARVKTAMAQQSKKESK